MKKVCIVIPDGTGIRNYLYSNLMKHLFKNKCEIVLLHNISSKAIAEIKKVHKQPFEVYKLPNYKETAFQKFLRETVCYARLMYYKKLVNNATLLNAWKPNTKSIAKKMFYKLVQFLGKLVSNKYSWVVSLEKIQLQLVLHKSTTLQKELLKQIQPDVIFSTHQRAMNALPLILAAHQLGIETVGVIFSWDNLPKARLTVKTDSYVVWSSYMKKELQLYYPEIDTKAITITGTPQFEFYFNKKFILPKKYFYEKYALDFSKKILCFSGDDVRTSPFDPVYLNDLASAIEKENLPYQIVLRRAPVDVSGRFKEVVLKYPSIIKEIAPLWNFDANNRTNWQIIYPTFKDVELLVSTVYYADAVVNVGSTMAHDFAMFGKPAIYLNYNSVVSKEWSIETIYQFQHFRSMQGLNPVLWLDAKKEIKKVLNCVFESPKLEQKAWLNLIAEHQKTASTRIAKKLISCT
ncbi:hypothetical protein [uncultured Lutibacter sp.]|uniref:hypothetical protein n=1 Tax=uncultured Lutibacter sp. TaxID=437739 RepID=UPI002601D84A|nr:hypothetical protein [uncultured Lutibacter sp.]